MITSSRENGIAMTGFLVFAVLPAAKDTSIDCRLSWGHHRQSNMICRGASGGVFISFLRFQTLGVPEATLIKKNISWSDRFRLMHGIYRKTLMHGLHYVLCILSGDDDFLFNCLML